MRRGAWLAVVAAVALGCDGDSTGAAVDADVGDGGAEADAGPPDAAPPADARENCPVPLNFVTPSAAGATATVAADGAITMKLAMDQEAKPDRFEMNLRRLGVFLDGVTVGEYPIVNAQTKTQSCALCLFVYADDGAETYLAQSGLVKLTKVSGSLEGTLQDVTFWHVSIGGDGKSTIIGDGCTTRISSMSFSLAL